MQASSEQLKRIEDASVRASTFARDVRVDARLGTVAEVRADMQALLQEVERLQAEVDTLGTPDAADEPVL